MKKKYIVWAIVIILIVVLGILAVYAGLYIKQLIMKKMMATAGKNMIERVIDKIL